MHQGPAQADADHQRASGPRGAARRSPGSQLAARRAERRGWRHGTPASPSMPLPGRYCAASTSLGGDAQPVRHGAGRSPARGSGRMRPAAASAAIGAAVEACRRALQALALRWRDAHHGAAAARRRRRAGTTGRGASRRRSRAPRLVGQADQRAEYLVGRFQAQQVLRRRAAGRAAPVHACPSGWRGRVRWPERTAPRPALRLRRPSRQRNRAARCASASQQARAPCRRARQSASPTRRRPRAGPGRTGWMRHMTPSASSSAQAPPAAEQGRRRAAPPAGARASSVPSSSTTASRLPSAGGRLRPRRAGYAGGHQQGGGTAAHSVSRECRTGAHAARSRRAARRRRPRSRASSGTRRRMRAAGIDDAGEQGAQRGQRELAAGASQTAARHRQGGGQARARALGQADGAQVEAGRPGAWGRRLGCRVVPRGRVGSSKVRWKAGGNEPCPVGRSTLTRDDPPSGVGQGPYNRRGVWGERHSPPNFLPGSATAVRTPRAASQPVFLP